MYATTPMLVAPSLAPLTLLLPSPRQGEGSGGRGRHFQYQKVPPLTPSPSPRRGEGSKSNMRLMAPRTVLCPRGGSVQETIHEAAGQPLRSRFVAEPNHRT